MPSCCLRWQIFKHSFYPVPLLKLFSFTFLAPFLWNHQKCPIPQNIWCLVKTQFKKNSTQTIFQGVSPWATLILNSMFAVVVLYCFKLLSEVKIFKHSFYLFPLLKLFFYLAPSSGNHNQKLFPKDELQSAKKNPWMTMIFISMFVVWVLYCVQLLIEMFFYKIIISFPLLWLLSLT